LRASAPRGILAPLYTPVIHVRPGGVVRLGPSSHVGHGAILHGCTLGEHVLVGMGAISHDDALVGDGAVIASGCVLLEGMETPPGKLVAGVPGRVVGDVRPEQHHPDSLD
jgi:phenylacetic acid degradation protein